MKNIPIARPAFLGNEKSYVVDCLDTQWISSIGKYVSRFEESFARWCGVRHAVSCCNGTAALHVSLLALGVGPGDEVIVPTLTFVATVNAVTMCGATPVFVDSDPVTWNLDANKIAQAITPKTRGIVAVHLYGHPADMDSILDLAKRSGLFVLEDAAEATGATIRGKKVGAIGDAGIFSFFGNKILTTGEGGIVTTNDDSLAKQMRLLRGQGQDPNKRYWFPVVGYNYRMTNVAAAIGLAQLEKAEDHLKSRRAIDEWYRKHLFGIDGITLQRAPETVSPVCWLFTLRFDSSWPERDSLMLQLAGQGIETRPVFYPIHTLPPYCRAQQTFPVAEAIAASSINLPTWHGMTETMVVYICEVLSSIRSGARQAA